MASSSFSAKLCFNSNCKQVLEQSTKGWRRSMNQVMELCAGGELFDRIIEKGHYSEHAAAVLCRQMVTVVHNCHSMGAMHRDLKPENFLLLSAAEDSPLKATYFGLSSSSNQAYGWGRGEHGRLGFGDDKSSKMVPQRVQLLVGEETVQVSCGGTHLVALTRDGRMFSVAS